MKIPHWTQFEASVLRDLRIAREALATVHGMASVEGLLKWSGEAKELATRVHELTKEIEENQRRVLQESISGPMPGVARAP